jgi:hypothetical protein
MGLHTFLPFLSSRLRCVRYTCQGVSKSRTRICSNCNIDWDNYFQVESYLTRSQILTLAHARHTSFIRRMDSGGNPFFLVFLFSTVLLSQRSLLSSGVGLSSPESETEIAPCPLCCTSVGCPSQTLQVDLTL